MKSFFSILTALFILRLFATEPLVFYHIPKCGGTTVNSLVGQHFHTTEIFHHKTKKDKSVQTEGPASFAAHNLHCLQLDRIDLNRIRYIHGHATYSRLLDIPEAKNFTFLRDPVERVFSAYRYVNQVRAQEFFDFYKHHSNGQVLQLSGLSRSDPTISLRDHLESAKRNLNEKFFFVGIAEQMQESIQLLYRLLNWEQLSLTPVFNRTIKKPYDPALYEFVFREEWADRELYEFAKSLFLEQLEKNSSIEMDNTNEPVEHVSVIHFNIEDPLDGEGWGYRELDLETNTRLRQSYVKNAFIRFPLLKQHYKVEAKIYFPSSSGLKSFKILVNGNQVRHSLTSNGKWKTVRFNLLKDWITQDKTKIVFHVSDLYVPSEHANIPDHRKLGVALASLDITPIY